MFNRESVVNEGNFNYKRYVYKYVAPAGTQIVLSILFDALTEIK